MGSTTEDYEYEVGHWLVIRKIVQREGGEEENAGLIAAIILLEYRLDIALEKIKAEIPM